MNLKLIIIIKRPYFNFIIISFNFLILANLICKIFVLFFLSKLIFGLFIFFPKLLYLQKFHQYLMAFFWLIYNIFFFSLQLQQSYYILRKLKVDYQLSLNLLEWFLYINALGHYLHNLLFFFYYLKVYQC